MDDRRVDPKSQLAWGCYNFGRLLGIAPRRRDAIAVVERVTGKPWAQARSYMEVRRVRVEIYRP